MPRLALRAGEGQTGLAIGPLALRTAKLSGVSLNAVKHFESRITEFPVNYQFQHALPVLL